MVVHVVVYSSSELQKHVYGSGIITSPHHFLFIISRFSTLQVRLTPLSTPTSPDSNIGQVRKEGGGGGSDRNVVHHLTL